MSDDVSKKGAPSLKRPTETAVHPSFYKKFVKGVSLAFSGLVMTLSEKSLRGEAKRAMKWAVVGLIPTLLVTGVVYILLYLPLLLISLFTDIKETMDNFTFTKVLLNLSLVVTMLSLTFIQVLGHTCERVFFSSLRCIDKTFAEKLVASPIMKKKTAELMYSIRLHMKFLKFAIIIFLLSFIPLIGPYIVQLAKFLSLRQKLGTGLALAIAVCFCIPGIKPYSLQFLQAWLAADELSLELIEPYTARLPTRDLRKYLNYKYQGLLIGLGFVYGALMTTPLIGLPLFIIAQSSAGLLLIEILKTNKKKDANVHLLGEDWIR